MSENFSDVATVEEKSICACVTEEKKVGRFSIKYLTDFKVDETPKTQDGPVKALDSFLVSCVKDKNCDIDIDINSRNFKTVTDEIELNICYDLYLVTWTGSAKVSECIDLIKKQNFLLFGPTILPHIKKKRKVLPAGVWIMSLDEESNAYRKSGDAMYACLRFDEDDEDWVEIQLGMYKLDVNGKEFSVICAKRKPPKIARSFRKR